MATVADYLALIAAAERIGEGFARLIRPLVEGHAGDALEPEELAKVRAGWADDVTRSARNAGLEPPTS